MILLSPSLVPLEEYEATTAEDQQADQHCDKSDNASDICISTEVHPVLRQQGRSGHQGDRK